MTKPSESSTPSLATTLKREFDADEEDSNAEAYYTNDDPEEVDEADKLTESDNGRGIEAMRREMEMRLRGLAMTMI